MTRKHEIILAIITILLIVPIFIVGFYNHPSADDFNYSINTHKAILNGENPIEIIGKAAKTSYHFYFTWQGLYASTFVLALQPAIWGEQFYALTTFIIVGILFAGIFILTKTVFKYIFKSERKRYWLISLFILFFMIEKIPSPVQGLYWFNGCMNYLRIFRSAFNGIGFIN